MFISSIRVINFRSLVDLHVDFTVYTALVGLNDAGKSNVLRALNLFFNGETDVDEPLMFERDFAQKAKVGKNKARQIIIELELQPPSHYQDSGPIVWRRVYRAGSVGFFTESLVRKDGQDFSANSRVAYWARSLAFEYVPAVRGRPFFNILKRRLHNALAATVAEKLKGASDAFLEGLRAEVSKIEEDSLRLLELRTEFSLPPDLGDLFEALEFNSADTGASTALYNRGDGVQGRHVPLILKFLAEQRKKNSAKGRPAAETIWGFEEPENNLELAKQVEVASEFAEYCAEVQIIVSTHSPAFYKVAKESEFGSVQFARRVEGVTDFDVAPVTEAVDVSLGLMPFVEPYLDLARKRRDEAVAAMDELKASNLLRNGNALIVEGSTDQVIVSGALRALDEELDAQIDFKEGMGGGVNWVADRCIARAALADVRGNTVALLDGDRAGKDAKKKVGKFLVSHKRTDRVKIILVGSKFADDHALKIVNSGVSISWAIEELCDPAVWEHAFSQGWLEPRTSQLLELNHGSMGKSETIESFVAERIESPELKLIVEHVVKPNMKMKFAKYAAELMELLGFVPPSLEKLVLTLKRELER